MNEIISIAEKSRPLAPLPDGLYYGVLGGYTIELKYESRVYELKVKEGVRGFGISVAVRVVNGLATYDTFKN